MILLYQTYIIIFQFFSTVFALKLLIQQNCNFFLINEKRHPPFLPLIILAKIKDICSRNNFSVLVTQWSEKI